MKLVAIQKPAGRENIPISNGDYNLSCFRIPLWFFFHLVYLL